MQDYIWIVYRKINNILDYLAIMITSCRVRYIRRTSSVILAEFIRCVVDIHNANFQPYNRCWPHNTSLQRVGPGHVSHLTWWAGQLSRIEEELASVSVMDRSVKRILKNFANFIQAISSTDCQLQYDSSLPSTNVTRVETEEAVSPWSWILYRE